jgi:exopolyphosphatase
LVDHNAWTGSLAARFPSPVIVGCIDHHEDEGVVPTVLPPGQPRVFAKCGSCMTLVVEQCKEAWDRLTSEGGPSLNLKHCDAQLARIALAPILVDTANLTAKDKTTERDANAVRVAESKLLSALSASSAEGEAAAAAGGAWDYERGKFYDELTRLKEQIGGMSYRDILRKDYKRWSEGSLSLGVSSVVQGFGYVIQEVGDKDQVAFLGALRHWAAEQKLDVVAVMTVSRPGGVFTRELLVWGLNEEGAKAVREFDLKYGSTLGLESWNAGELDGGSIQGTDSEGLRLCWTQRAIENSRKQVGPMLRAAMRESSRL